MSSSISESTNLISFYLTYLLTAVVLCRINSALMHHYAHTDTTGTLRKGDRSKKCPAPKVSRAREEDQQVESRGWETQNWPPPPPMTIKEGAHHVPTNSALLKARLGWAGLAGRHGLAGKVVCSTFHGFITKGHQPTKIDMLTAYLKGQ